MTVLRSFALAAVVSLAACSSKKDDGDHAAIKKAAPPAATLQWSRAYIVAPAGSAPAVMYVAIDNRAGKADTLLRVTTPVVDIAMLHRNMSSEKGHGTMSMVPVSTIEAPAETLVQLIPGGTHVMLMPPFKQKITRGDSIPVTLHFSHAGAITGKAAVISYSDVDTATAMKLQSR